MYVLSLYLRIASHLWLFNLFFYWGEDRDPGPPPINTSRILHVDTEHEGSSLVKTVMFLYNGANMIKKKYGAWTIIVLFTPSSSRF